MSVVPFVTRHSVKPAQQETAKLEGFSLVQDSREVIFVEETDPAQKLQESGIADKTLAIVAPTWVTLELLRQGYTLLEFVNYKSARARNVFLCKGMYVHTLKQSNFVPCPVDAEAQEESELSPVLRPE